MTATAYQRQSSGTTVGYVGFTVRHPNLNVCTQSVLTLIDTSKANRQSVYSCKGQYLAALATVSLVTITSRHHSQPHTNTVIFHDSQAIARHVPDLTHHAIDTSHGTRITVNNLFGKMPVRVKHRALSLRRREDIDKEWDELKRMMVALVLSNSNFQRLRISDREKQRLVNIRLSSKGTDPTLETQNSGLYRLHAVLTQSGLVSGYSATDWAPMTAETSDISVEACVALTSSPTKLNQFISFGINPIFKTNSTANVLYDAVNQVFADSSFGSVPAELDTRTGSSRGLTRGTKRWPMFYVRIDLRGSLESRAGDEISIQANSTLQQIIQLLQAMFHQFLQQHHYRPGTRNKSSANPSTSDSPYEPLVLAEKPSRESKRTCVSAPLQGGPATTTLGRLENEARIVSADRKERSRHFGGFTGWSRVKSGGSSGLEELLMCRPTSLNHSHGLRYSNSEPESDSIRGAEQQPTTAQSLHENAGDKQVQWVDPIFNQPILVNTRTGHCVPNDCVQYRPRTTLGFRPLSAGSLSGSTGRPQTEPTQSQSAWFNDLLKKQMNMTFPYPERPIKTIESKTTFENSLQSIQSSRCHSWKSSEEAPGNVRHNGKLSKEALATATTIAQVDRKFILVRMRAIGDCCDCSVPSASRQILVLVDQHAADERCRVEDLFSEMFRIEEQTGVILPNIYAFSESLVIPIHENEHLALATYSEYFGSWGCRYRVQQELIDGKSQYSIIVEALPRVIAERCRLEPKLIIEFLRKEIWNRAGERVPHPRRSRIIDKTDDSNIDNDPRSNNTFWLPEIAGCPEGIVDLINSRACRTSIMFNDTLDLHDCRELIGRLSKCVFPFQCAHGRPTMIPIVDESHHLMELLPASPASRESDGYDVGRHDLKQNPLLEQSNFIAAFKRWKKT